MKILKVILVFAILAGGIFLLLNWESIVNPSAQGEAEDDVVNAECSKISEEWSSREGWDEKLFKDQIDNLNQKKSYSKYQGIASTVKRRIIECAIEKIDIAMFNEFDKSDCRDEVIKDNYKGVLVLEKHGDIGKHKRIEKIKATYSLYKNISNFIGSKHKIVPDYKKDTKSWCSFLSIKTKILGEAKRYKDNQYYAKLNKISRFNDGLNQNYLCGIIDAQKKGFYNTLANDIMTHFKELEANVSDYELETLKREISDVNQKYWEEEKDNRTVRDFCKNLRDRIDERVKKYNDEQNER